MNVRRKYVTVVLLSALIVAIEAVMAEATINTLEIESLAVAAVPSLVGGLMLLSGVFLGGRLTRCPGAGPFAEPLPETFMCPHCGGEVEIFTNKQRLRRYHCGGRVTKEKRPNCFDWCKYADKRMQDIEAHRRRAQTLRLAPARTPLLERLHVECVLPPDHETDPFVHLHCRANVLGTSVESDFLDTYIPQMLQ